MPYFSEKEELAGETTRQHIDGLWRSFDTGSFPAPIWRLAMAME
jgi:hypothetical protein